MTYTLPHMSNNQPMHRTQVYLTEAEHRAIKALARRSGRSFAAVMREAIDAYVSRDQAHDLQDAVEASHGCWRNHETDTDLRTLRKEWEVRESRQK